MRVKCQSHFQEDSLPARLLCSHQFVGFSRLQPFFNSSSGSSVKPLCTLLYLPSPNSRRGPYLSFQSMETHRLILPKRWLAKCGTFTSGNIRNRILLAIRESPFLFGLIPISVVCRTNRGRKINKVLFVQLSEHCPGGYIFRVSFIILPVP